MTRVANGAAGALGLVLVVCATSAPAQTSVAPAGGQPAAAPAAFHGFCREFPSECAAGASRLGSMTLIPERWRELQQINARVNASISEVSDQDHYGREDVWTLPLDGKGDCEDFALLKRSLLLKQGWPPSALLMTTVRTRSGEGHAVLTVVTDQGDYVLDNKTSAIRIWSATGYTFFTRQSQASPRRWAWIDSTPPAIASRAVGPGSTAQTRAAR